MLRKIRPELRGQSLPAVSLAGSEVGGRRSEVGSQRAEIRGNTVDISKFLEPQNVEQGTAECRSEKLTSAVRYSLFDIRYSKIIKIFLKSIILQGKQRSGVRSQ